MTFASLAVVGLASGITTAMLSKQTELELTSRPHEAAERTALESKRGTLSTVSYASYGVAGAAAITAGITFFLSRFVVADPPVAAGASITPSGASAMAVVQF